MPRGRSARDFGTKRIWAKGNGVEIALCYCAQRGIDLIGIARRVNSQIVVDRFADDVGRIPAQIRHTGLSYLVVRSIVLWIQRVVGTHEVRQPVRGLVGIR